MENVVKVCPSCGTLLRKTLKTHGDYLECPRCYCLVIDGKRKCYHYKDCIYNETEECKTCTYEPGYNEVRRTFKFTRCESTNKNNSCPIGITDCIYALDNSFIDSKCVKGLDSDGYCHNYVCKY